MMNTITSLQALIDRVDYEGLSSLLSNQSALANAGMPFDAENPTEAHPLHRICDGVFQNKYTDDQAVEMAKIFLAHGANVNGFALKEKQDTPLIAAASLQAEKVGLLYIERRANIHHAGCHGGTALHWAAWCGRDILAGRLIREHAEINRICIDFKSTPLFWAVHGFIYGGEQNRNNQFECARMLVKVGADKNIPNFEGYAPLQLLGKADVEWIKLLQ
jgi:uncharacterized protein